LCEGVMDKKSSATTDSCRVCAFGGSWKAKESVVRWGAVRKFSEGRSRFYPGAVRQKISGLWESMKSEMAA